MQQQATQQQEVPLTLVQAFEMLLHKDVAGEIYLDCGARQTLTRYVETSKPARR